MEDKEEKPYLILKFGDIKGGYFKDNEEANKLFSEARNLCVTNEDYRQNALAIVKAFNGDIFSWWENRNVTKKEALDNIKNCVYPTPPIPLVVKKHKSAKEFLDESKLMESFVSNKNYEQMVDEFTELMEKYHDQFKSNL